jgi:hypothetical protein
MTSFGLQATLTRGTLAAENPMALAPAFCEPTAHGLERDMNRLAVFACIILAFGVATSRAGPCTSDILNIEKAVNEPNSPYAPSARQSVGAQLGRQPTPSSMARAEEKADSSYTAALDRARALDNQNNPDCAQAVKQLKELLGMP